MPRLESEHSKIGAAFNGRERAIPRTVVPAETYQQRSRGKSVGAVVNAMQILRYLDQVRMPVRSIDIARSLRLNPSTCFNILQTLFQERVVSFDPIGKFYELRQPLSLRLPQSAQDVDEVSFLKQAAERLATKHQLFVSLWRPSDDRLVLVLAVKTPHFNVRMPVGSRVPMYLGSAGRVMAAASDVSLERLKAQLEGLRWDRPPPLESYAQDLVSVRQNGWAVDRENLARGFVSISTPLQDEAGRIKYACSATLPSPEWSEERGQSIAADLLAIGRLLGHDRPAASAVS